MENISLIHMISLRKEREMTKLFDLPLVFEQIPKLLKFLHINIEIAIIALIIGWIVGLIIAMIRIKKIPVLRQLAVAFVSIIRGTPIIVQLYLTYFGIPIMLRYINYYWKTDYNINGIPPILFAIVALGLNQAAFDSESIRAAIQSVEKGQIEAAKSIGMTGGQVLRRVLLPQAFSVALPPLGNSLIGLIKGTSLVFVCSVVEMTAEGKILAGNNYRFFESYCSIAIIFWVVTVVIEFIFKKLEKVFSVPEQVQIKEAK